ncbi:unnamed protein product [Parascedosporium putredinis]|uniref:Uncharacterized protein n=1 Tax=Parascedosporium putredinis TaxID=1442378 RepID=A0A9P1MAS9_9PEZI|nr:unnamed protein product [Parascedosporium putredinis]CAI7998225.1 unnamed protein product [Parascedosporium putredinis]
MVRVQWGLVVPAITDRTLDTPPNPIHEANSQSYLDTGNLFKRILRRPPRFIKIESSHSQGHSPNSDGVTFF